VLEYAMGAAAVAVGWSGYLVSLLASLGLGLPERFTTAYGAPLHDPATMGLFNVPAAAIVLVITALLVIGAREEQQKFLDLYAAELARAYPAQPDGTVLLRIPRLFILAQR
jgi:trans-aconitate methyltransferase